MATRRHHLALSVFALSLYAGALPAGGVLDALDALGGSKQQAGQREFLPPDQAFVFSHEFGAAGRLLLNWEIAPGYYLYRDKLAFEALSPGIRLGPATLPAGEAKQDPEFGPVEIYRERSQIAVPIETAGSQARRASLRVTYQGCAEDGICYPPIKKVLDFALADLMPAAAAAPTVAGMGDLPADPAAPHALSASDRIAARLASGSLPAVIGSFLVFGLLLALTPCVFPMVPILSGIIVGQHQPVTAARSLVLSAVYVLAMAATYALAGLAAGLFGKNLQAGSQHPAVLIAFSAVFVLLALSMFGFFTLQAPAAWRTRLDRMSHSGRGGHLGGVAGMGALSAIIVGPCVAPPLAGALVYLGHQGNPLIGGLALFALGLGMGLPLLLIGASAGQVLPRAGAWMEVIKRAFGVVFLGVAIWFLARVIPAPAVLVLWALLLIGSAIYLGALEPLHDTASGWQRFWKGMGLALLCYGVVLIVGAAAGAEDPWAPLAPLASRNEAGVTDSEHSFTAIKGPAGLESQLAVAARAGRPVLLDFYADWCIECKHLERDTFSNPQVREALAGFVLLRADVTSNDPLDQALLRRCELFGPPAVLFFDHERGELRQHRLNGYLGPEQFQSLLREAYTL